MGNSNQTGITMKRAFIVVSIVAAIVILFFALWPLSQPPEGILIEDGVARVKAYAAYNMWGEDGNGGGRKEYRLIEPVSPTLSEWLGDHGYERIGFEPYQEVGYADSLDLYPLFIGFVTYRRIE